MGCDIHMHTEYFEKDRWHSGDYFRVEVDYGGNEELITMPIYEERDYVLFSVLADVRNTNGFEPICPPKGLPNDACKQTKQDFVEWMPDAHSVSYFTLRELMDFTNQDLNLYNVHGRGPQSPLIPLIELLVQRAKELFYTNHQGFIDKDLASKIRIVFWFDN